MCFLNEKSKDAFVDFPKPKQRKKVCQKCKGHGGWNLKLNAYPLHDKKNTKKNRHLFSHFRASCSACWGYGFLQNSTICPKSKNQGHDFDHNFKCKKCKKQLHVDSSD